MSLRRSEYRSAPDFSHEPTRRRLRCAPCRAVRVPRSAESSCLVVSNVCRFGYFVSMTVQTQPDDKSTALTRTIGNITGWLGSFPAIMLSILLVFAWFVGGFFVNEGFTNNTYQLLINTG